MKRYLPRLVNSSSLVAILLVSSPGFGASFETRDERLAAQQRVDELGDHSVVGTIEYDALVTVAAAEFRGTGNDLLSLDFARFCPAGSCEFLAGVHVPHGATIVGVEIDACDEDAAAGTIGITLARVQGHGGVFPEVLSAFDAGLGCVYTFEALANPHQVDQYLDSYVIWVAISNGDFDERLVAARVYYRSGDGEVVPIGTTPSLFQ